MFHIICMYSGTHLKGTQSEEALRTLSIGMGCKIHRQQLFTQFMAALFEINVWKKKKNVTMNTAILCLAVCVRNIMDKAGICGTGVYYAHTDSFLLFIGN